MRKLFRDTESEAQLEVAFGTEVLPVVLAVREPAATDTWRMDALVWIFESFYQVDKWIHLVAWRVFPGRTALLGPTRTSGRKSKCDIILYRRLCFLKDC